MILISTHDEGAFAELIERSSALGFLPKTELSGAAIRRMLASATSGRQAARSVAVSVEEPDRGEHTAVIIIALGQT